MTKSSKPTPPKITKSQCVVVTSGNLGIRVGKSRLITFPTRARYDRAFAYLASQAEGAQVSRADLALALAKTRDGVSTIVAKVNSFFKDTHNFNFDVIEKIQSKETVSYRLSIPIDWWTFEALATEAQKLGEQELDDKALEQSVKALGGYPFPPFLTCDDWPLADGRKRALDGLFAFVCNQCVLGWERQSRWKQIRDRIGPLVNPGWSLEYGRIYLRALVALGEIEAAQNALRRLLQMDDDPDWQRQLRHEVPSEAGIGKYLDRLDPAAVFPSKATDPQPDHRQDAHAFIDQAFLLEDIGRRFMGSQSEVRELVTKALKSARFDTDRALIEFAAWTALTTIEGRDDGPLNELKRCLKDVSKRSTDSIETAFLRAVIEVHKLFAGCTPEQAQAIRISVEQIAAEASAANHRGDFTDRELARILYAQVIVNHENVDVSHRLDIGINRVAAAKRSGDDDLIYHSLRHLVPVLFACGTKDQASSAIGEMRKLENCRLYSEPEVLALETALAAASHDPSFNSLFGQLFAISQDAHRHWSVFSLAAWWSVAIHSDTTGFPEEVKKAIDEAVSLTEGDGLSVELPFRAMAAYTDARRFGKDEEPSSQARAAHDTSARRHLRYVHKHRALLPQTFGGLISAAGCIEVAWRLGEKQIALDLAELLVGAEPMILQAVSGAFIFGSVHRFLGFAAACHDKGCFAGLTANGHFKKAQQIETKRGFPALARMSAEADALVKRKK